MLAGRGKDRHPLQFIEFVADVLVRAFKWLQKDLIAGQQIPALAGLDIDQCRHQFIRMDNSHYIMLTLLSRLLDLVVGPEHDAHDHQHKQQHRSG